VLDSLRKNSQSFVVKALLGAIVIVFMFWGVGTFRARQLAVVARVNGEVISQREFERAYRNAQRTLSERLKTNLPEDVLRDQTLDQLITLRLLTQEAQKLGLVVTEEELRDSIAAIPQFQANGRFNRELYLRVLRVNELTPVDFEASQSQQLLVQKVQELIAAGAHVTETQVLDRFRYDNEQVDLKVVKVAAADFAAGIQMTDEEAKAYFDAHRESFREPSRTKIRYIYFAADHFAEQAKPDEDAIRAYYEEHSDQYRRPEQVRARQILLKVPEGATEEQKQAVRARAEEILARARSGEDFATLAREYSEDTATAAQGGDLGFFERGQMLPPFEQAAFGLEPGQISDLIEGPSGFHIVEVEEKRPAGPAPLDEVRDEVIKDLKQRMGREQALADVDDAYDRLLDGQDLDAVAKSFGLRVSEPPPFSQDEPIVGLPSSTEVREAALASAVGEVGDVVTLESGYVVFIVTERKESYIPEFDQVRAAVEKELRKERAREEAHKRAEALLAQLQEDAGRVSGIATGDGVTVADTGPFRRAGSYVPKVGTSAEIKEAAFRLTPEKPVAPAVYVVNGDAFVAVLAKKLPAPEDEFAGQKETLVEQERRRLEGALVEQFVNYLKAKAKIEYGEAYTAQGN